MRVLISLETRFGWPRWVTIKKMDVSKNIRKSDFSKVAIKSFSENA